MNNGEVISQSYLNSLLLILWSNLQFKEEGNIDEDNEMFTFDFDDYNQTPSGDEVIVNSAFSVTFKEDYYNNKKFTGFNYYLRLYYYELSADMDDSDNVPVQYRDFQLETQRTWIEFGVYPVYLLKDYEVIIKS